MFAISIPIPPVAVGWVILSLLIGLFAVAKGRPFLSWFVASLFATPFVGACLFFLPHEAKSPTAPSRLPKPHKRSLVRRTLGAAGFRLKDSRAGKAVAGAKGVAHRSLEGFAVRAELDHGITKSVRDQFMDARSTRKPS
jgi:hypothetical protein